MSEQLIPRRSQLWLLIVNIAVLLPLSPHATSWSLGICTICWLWRLGIYFGKVAKPPRILVSGLALGAAATLALVATDIGALNALINLLILGYALKYIEIRQQRDIHTIVLAGFFLVALSFIDNQSMGAALIMLIIVMLNLAALMSLYITHISVIHAFGFIGRWLLLSAPLALCLFLILPRLPPLWLSPQLNTTVTGLSNEMALGDITELTRSNELVFRVSFDAQIPAVATLYWRALVLEDFDGERWRQQAHIQQAEAQVATDLPARRPDLTLPERQIISYDIIMEPSQQTWLVGLDTAFSQSDHVVNTYQYRLLAKQAVNQTMRYRVSSVSNSPMGLDLIASDYQANLLLPTEHKALEQNILNPQTVSLGQEFGRRFPDPNQRLKAMQQYFQQQPFFYTLTPPRLGAAQIDDFLFTSKQGFCGHYASALVYLARASGMPARVVSGYQGGIVSPDKDFVSVYQYMAHAWVEVWIQGQGWVRADPTAMIAPERVLDGFDALFTPQQSYLAQSHQFSQKLQLHPWFIALQSQFHMADYYWSQWVLGFDNDKQLKILNQLFGTVSALKIGALLLASLAISLILLLLVPSLSVNNRRHDALARHYRRLSAYLHSHYGLSAVATPREVHQSISAHHPHLNDLSLSLYQDFIYVRYQEAAPKAETNTRKALERNCHGLIRKLYWRLVFYRLRQHLLSVIR
ncbi:DUF3488 and transglutaminase-like domain-containing protein [Shewanella sp. SNU WT4]|uniref:transglutaminase family protein n=1 Tax=Shewanella sp. SNU WT4 TaxID=2590015 RepID=UPI00143D2620|nr:DUF3488 and transglutaminase-like domain-containing protein [Shewanella sp. SNU WT4]